MSKIEYRLTWSRTYLKKYGLLQNSSRGVWSFLSTINLEDLNPKDIVKTQRRVKLFLPIQQPKQLSPKLWKNSHGLSSCITCF